MVLCDVPQLRNTGIFHSKTVDGEMSFALVNVEPQLVSPIWHGAQHKTRYCGYAVLSENLSEDRLGNKLCLKRTFCC